MLQGSLVNGFFPCTARLWNYMALKLSTYRMISFIYDRTGFKSRINRYLLPVDSFKTDFLQALIFLYFFFLNHSDCSALLGVTSNWKNIKSIFEIQSFFQLKTNCHRISSFAFSLGQLTTSSWNCLRFTRRNCSPFLVASIAPQKCIHLLIFIYKKAFWLTICSSW